MTSGSASVRWAEAASDRTNEREAESRASVLPLFLPTLFSQPSSSRFKTSIFLSLPPWSLPTQHT